MFQINKQKIMTELFSQEESLGKEILEFSKTLNPALLPPAQDGHNIFFESLVHLLEWCRRCLSKTQTEAGHPAGAPLSESAGSQLTRLCLNTQSLLLKHLSTYTD